MTRILSIAVLVAVAAAFATTDPARAQRYSPYCAQFTDGSGMDCSYPSLQSCLAAVNGVGGICTVNPRSPDQPPPPPGFLPRLMQGNGPAFAPVDVGPPDPRLSATAARRSPRRVWPYCASYTDGSTNCGFPSMQSCRAAVSGVGGTCRINPRAQRR